MAGHPGFCVAGLRRAAGAAGARVGGWVLYFLFIGGCFSTDKWLHLLAEQPWMVVFPVGVLAALAVCGAKWLMKAAVK